MHNNNYNNNKRLITLTKHIYILFVTTIDITKHNYILLHNNDYQKTNNINNNNYNYYNKRLILTLTQLFVTAKLKVIHVHLLRRHIHNFSLE